MEAINHKENIVKLCGEINKLSTDERETHKLLNELLSEQRQDVIKPLQVSDMGEEIKRVTEDTFYVAQYEKGIIYHIYNSIYLVVPSSLVSLHSALMNIINYNEEEIQDKEEIELYKNYFSAMAFVLSSPTYIFGDEELLFDVATRLVTYHNDLYNKSMDVELAQETILEDEKFKQAVLELENFKKEFSE